jgi:hypothetical protein
MPLSGSTVDMYFPEVRFRERERHYRRFDVAASRRSRQREKEQHQKRRRYQTQVAQAEIDLAFVTPAGLVAWYQRQERQGIYDDDLIDMVQSWSSRFSGLPYDCLYSGQPLWPLSNNWKRHWQAGQRRNTGWILSVCPINSVI